MSGSLGPRLRLIQACGRPTGLIYVGLGLQERAIMLRVLVWCLVFGLFAVSAVRAETLTSIAASSIDDPKSFWRATMEEFYGPYDNRRKCWVAARASEPLCMRPHLLSTVIEDGVPTLYTAMAGHAINAEGGHADCHACTGKLGLVVLRPGVTGWPWLPATISRPMSAPGARCRRRRPSVSSNSARATTAG